MSVINDIFDQMFSKMFPNNLQQWVLVLKRNLNLVIVDFFTSNDASWVASTTCLYLPMFSSFLFDFVIAWNENLNFYL